MDELIAKYKNPSSGLIEYRRFCDNIDKVFFDAEEASRTAMKARSEGVGSSVTPLDLLRRREADVV